MLIENRLPWFVLNFPIFFENLIFQLLKRQFNYSLQPFQFSVTQNRLFQLRYVIFQARRHWEGRGAMPPPIICQTCFWRFYKRSLIWQQFWQQFILAIHAPPPIPVQLSTGLLSFKLYFKSTVHFSYVHTSMNNHSKQNNKMIHQNTCTTPPGKLNRQCNSKIQ